MLETIRKIISNVLQAIYQPFFFALILSILVLFFVMFLDKYQGTTMDKIKAAAGDWKDRFIGKVQFRRGFYLTFCAVMVLFKTLLNRNIWANPFSDVIGLWGLYDKDGNFTTEIIENTLLFVPLIFFLFFFWETTERKTTSFLHVIGKGVVVTFAISFTIEMLQLFLRIGTWQLSDLCFNTLGGLIGALIYWITAKLRKK